MHTFFALRNLSRFDHSVGSGRRGPARGWPPNAGWFRRRARLESTGTHLRLLDRVAATPQARRIGALVVAVGGLLLGLRLLGGLRRRPVVGVLSHRAGSGAHSGTLARVATDGAADSPHRRAARRTSHRAALLRRRRGSRLGRRGRVEARLLLGPGVALVLVLPERVLALPRLGVDEDFGLCRAHEHARGESGNDRGGPALHVRSPCNRTVLSYR